jgi:translation initiation factor IF-2
LTEGLTVKDLAEKLDVKSKDMIKKLMDRGVFTRLSTRLDKEMAKNIAKGVQRRRRIRHIRRKRHA